MLFIINRLKLDQGVLVKMSGYKGDGIPRRGIISRSWLSLEGIPCMTLSRFKDDGESEGIEFHCYHIERCDGLEIIP